MRDRGNGRLFFAALFALAAGALVAFANPVPRLRADMRADAQGFVLSLEYSVHMLRG